MSGNARQGKDNPLHYIVASDRLFALGYSADEVNAYLSQTPFEELVQAISTQWKRTLPRKRPPP